MRKTEIRRETVGGLKFPNQGIVRTGEGVFVIKNTLPGQTISFYVRRKRAGRSEGQLVEILSASPEETVAPCPHFRVCGGCAYQSVPIETENEWKRQMVFELLSQSIAEYPGMADEDFFEGIIPSPSESGYRNKMEFSFGNMEKGGALTLGMHVSGHFHDVVTVDGCRIADPDMTEILRAVLHFAHTREWSAFNRNTHEGFLRHLLVRKGQRDGEIMLDIVTTSGGGVISPDFTDMLLALKLKGRFVGILHTLNDSPSDAIVNEGTRVLYGRDYFTETILGRQFRITPFSFFQTNTAGAEVLYRKVREYAGESRRGKIFDLYCGTGTIAQLVSDLSKEVIGVELVEEAVEAARENAGRNGIENVRFISADVAKVVEGLPEAPELVVVDPPREGMSPKALGGLLRLGAKSIIYVSCKPTSLARDMKELFLGGYRLGKAAAVNLFPRTTGIETVALFERE